jgi:hypothetical protein
MISRGGSLGKATDSPERLFAWLVRNVERLVEELEHYQVRAGALEVYVGYKDGRAGVGRATLAGPSDRFDRLLEAAKLALRQAFVRGVPATRMHLTASRLRWPGAVQLGLFELPAPHAEKLARVKRDINARFGRFTLRSAATLPLADIYRDASNGYDICDVRGKLCF